VHCLIHVRNCMHFLNPEPRTLSHTKCTCMTRCGVYARRVCARMYA
jgi:hypothetical protein